MGKFAIWHLKKGKESLIKNNVLSLNFKVFLYSPIEFYQAFFSWIGKFCRSTNAKYFENKNKNHCLPHPLIS